VDSAVRNITQPRSAFGADPPAEEIWVLLTRPVDPKPNGDLPDSATKPEKLDQWDDNFLGTKVSGIDVLKRAVELLTDEIYLGDLDTAIEWNTLLGPVEKLLAAAKDRQLPPPLRSAVDDLRRAAGVVGKRAVKLYVVAPREWYGEQPNDDDRDNSAINFSPAAIACGIAHVRKVAANRASGFENDEPNRRKHAPRRQRRRAGPERRRDNDESWYQKGRSVAGAQLWRGFPAESLKPHLTLPSWPSAQEHAATSVTLSSRRR